MHTRRITSRLLGTLFVAIDARPTIPIGTFPMPAFNTSVNLRIDVTSALRQLVKCGAEFATLRLDPVGLTDAAIIGGRAGESTSLVLQTAQTAEPATPLLLATGLGDRRRTASQEDACAISRAPPKDSL
jgi:hypothetical protein